MRSKNMWKLRGIAICVGVVMLAGCATLQSPTLSDTDEVFIDKIQRFAFRYFEECSNKEKGLVQDRAPNFMPPAKVNDERYEIASVAATGYYLSAYVVAAERGWATMSDAETRVLNTLRFFANEMENVHGFYYHFVNVDTGERAWGSELSSIDTALFLGGVIHAKEYFKGNDEIQSLAKTIYERVDWQWMTNETNFLNMGWKPTRKGGRFLRQSYDHFCEGLIAYVMAIGSPTHALSPESWHKLSRRVKRYGDYTCIAYSALFVHQYPHVWIDFRDKNDGHADYFANSTQATLANRQYSIDNMDKYTTYAEDIWGLTACDGPDGYKAYGGKPGYENHDGTIAPTAAGGALPFTPELSITALRALYEKYGDHLWGRYGFADSFNVDRDWYATDCIAIDQGTILLMAENMRSEGIWKYTMQNSWIQEGMKRIGFEKGTMTVEMPKPPQLTAQKMTQTVTIDAQLDEWDLSSGFNLDQMYHEYGEIDDKKDYSGKMYFGYDDTNLYFSMKIKDDEIVGRKGGSFIYKEDCVEIYVDPQKDGLEWNNKKDVQLGLAPNTRNEEGKVRSWAWFQNTNTEKDGSVTAKWKKAGYGYVLEAAIKWEVLQIQPGDTASFSVSLHDKDAGNEVKLTTYFEDFPGKEGVRELGTLTFAE